MSLPIPPVKLEDHCSVIHDNTLYIYTPESFLSLPLKLNGKWNQLPMGQSVTGAACVKGGVDGDNNQTALYVVGGTTDSPDYAGLQRYSFQKGQWETLYPPTRDIQNRTYHGAAYLNTLSSIVVYAGSQDDSANPSTQTFLVSTAPPYGIMSFNSQGALPAVSPMLLPWDDSRAALLGGDSASTKVFVFSPTAGWEDSGASLAQGLPDQVKCALVQGDDGSKVLEIFDMSVSPNTVTRVALLDAGGVPAPPGQLVGVATSSTNQPSAKSRRDLTLANYPPYNDTFAPKVTRTGYSLAQDDNGLVVISGGSETDPICIFDQSANSWVNASRLFNGDKIATTTGPSKTATATSITSSPSSTAAAGSGESSHTRTNTILGATLGSVLGVAALLIVALFVLARLKKKKKDMERSKGPNGDGSDDKDRLSFQDQGIEPLARSAVPMGRGPVPSTDSFAIMSGRFDPEKYMASSTLSRSYGHQQSKSTLTTLASGRTDGATSAMSGPDRRPPQRSSPDDLPRGDRRTDEGWSRYFKDNDATDLVRMDSTRSADSSDGAKSDNDDISEWPRVSARVTPLNLRIPDPTTISRVPSGSPSTEHVPWDKEGRGFGIHQGQSAKISSADSISLASDDDDDRDRPDAFSSGITESVYEDSRLSARDLRNSQLRPPSSNYSTSLYAPPLPRGSSTPAERSWIQSRGNDTIRSSVRQSSVVIHDYEDQPNRNNINTDMSWLNLGTNT